MMAAVKAFFLALVVMAVNAGAVVLNFEDLGAVPSSPESAEANAKILKAALQNCTSGNFTELFVPNGLFCYRGEFGWMGSKI